MAELRLYCTSETNIRLFVNNWDLNEDFKKVYIMMILCANTLWKNEPYLVVNISITILFQWIAFASLRKMKWLYFVCPYFCILYYVQSLYIQHISHTIYVIYVTYMIYIWYLSYICCTIYMKARRGWSWGNIRLYPGLSPWKVGLHCVIRSVLPKNT